MAGRRVGSRDAGVGGPRPGISRLRDGCPARSPIRVAPGWRRARCGGVARRECRLRSVTFRPLAVYTRRCTLTTELAERQNLAALLRGRGRGPGGQPTGLELPAGRCPVPGCEERIDRTRLMCRGDWYRVPKRQRDRVWRTWHSGREASSLDHQEAALKAIAAARIARLPWPRRHLARLRLLSHQRRLFRYTSRAAC